MAVHLAAEIQSICSYMDDEREGDSIEILLNNYDNSNEVTVNDRIATLIS